MKEAVLGVDIGGTNTVFGLVDEKGEILTEGTMSTLVSENVEDYLDALHKMVQEALCSFPEDIRIIGVGIGAPNGNYYSGTIEFAPNLNWKGVVRLSDLFRKYFNVPVALTNDANAAAIGEMLYGGARGMKDFIIITLGTGLGSGIVINGKVVYGHDGFAGELGHSIVNPDGRMCGCGRKGCLEVYASAPGIKRTVGELLDNFSGQSNLQNVSFDQLTAKMISEAALNNDKLAIEAFDYTAKMLGFSLANAVAFSSPEAIFLFGGLANSGDLLLLPTKKYMEENLLNIYKNKVKLLTSELMDKNAAILGAAALIRHELNR